MCLNRNTSHHLCFICCLIYLLHKTTYAKIVYIFKHYLYNQVKIYTFCKSNHVNIDRKFKSSYTFQYHYNMSASLHASNILVKHMYKDYKLFYTYTHYKTGFVNPRGHYLNSDKIIKFRYPIEEYYLSEMMF